MIMLSYVNARALHLVGQIVIVFLVVTVVTFVGLRLYVGYSNESRITTLEQQLDILTKRLESEARDRQASDDEFRKALYGDIEPKVTANTAANEKNQQRGSIVIFPTWYQNRDKQLDDRLRALERWRVQMER